MRIGHNPQRFKKLIKKEFYHKIIIPIHIPDEETEYHKYSFDVLKMCIESLLQTVHSQTNVTLINNNSRKDVTSYLNELVEKNQIHQLIHYTVNNGKVDPCVKEMRGAFETLVTIADADVLFKVGWQQEVEKVFTGLPNVGMVSPAPHPALIRYHNIWSWYFGFSKKCFTKNTNPDEESLKKLKHSIGLSTELTEIEKYPLGISFGGVEALFGASHFCATYHRNIIKHIPNMSSGENFTNAELLFLDKPIENARLMRLATVKSWVYHMGNVPESWMKLIIEENKKTKSTFNTINDKVILANPEGFLKNVPRVDSIIERIVRSTRFKNLVLPKTKFLL